MRLPFLTVAGLAAAGRDRVPVAAAAGDARAREAVPLRQLLRVRAVAICALTVVVAASTAAMLEPAVSLWLSSDLGSESVAGRRRVRRRGGCGDGAPPGVRTLGRPLGRAPPDDDRPGRDRVDDAAPEPRVGLPVGDRVLRADGRGPGAGRDAVARLHGRSDLGGGRRIVRRLVRGLQLCVGNRAARRPGDRRVSCSSCSDLRGSRWCGCHLCSERPSCWPRNPPRILVFLFRGFFRRTVHDPSAHRCGADGSVPACAAQSISADVKADERGHVKFEGGLGKRRQHLRRQGGARRRQVDGRGQGRSPDHDQRRERPDRRPRRGKDLRARRQEEDLHRDDVRRRCGGGWRRRARRPRPTPRRCAGEAGGSAARSEGQGDGGRLQPSRRPASARRSTASIRIRRS